MSQAPSQASSKPPSLDEKHVEKPEDEEEDEEEDDEEEEDDHPQDAGPASEWVDRLRKRETLTVGDLAKLHSIIAKMKGQPQWKRDFMNEKGLDELAALLSDEAQFKGAGSAEARKEIVGCLDAYLDDAEWGPSLLATSYLLPNLVLCLEDQDHEVRRRVLVWLTLLCFLVPDTARGLILEALSSTKVKNIEGKKYDALTVLVMDLKRNSISPKGESQVSDILFINSLINSTNSLEDRMQLRLRLKGLGFQDIIDELNLLVEGKAEHQKLQEQLEVYDGGLIKDQRETETGDLKLSDPESLWTYLYQTAQQDGFLGQFLSILQCLSTILPSNGERMWNNCQHMVHLITQEKEGARVSFADLKKALVQKEQDDKA